MGKKSWDAFVTKYGSGHCISFSNFVGTISSGLGVNGKKLPSVTALIGEAITKGLKHDWAVRTETVHGRSITAKGTRKITGKVIHFVFADENECRAVAKFLGTQLHTLTLANRLPCRTHDKVQPFEHSDYERLAKGLGYLP